MGAKRHECDWQLQATALDAEQEDRATSATRRGESVRGSCAKREATSASGYGELRSGLMHAPSSSVVDSAMTVTSGISSGQSISVCQKQCRQKA